MADYKHPETIALHGGTYRSDPATTAVAVPIYQTTFPTALDPMQVNRYEMGKFMKECFDLGINYLGVCCGANPMLIRETAHAVGLTVPASKYKEKMSNHFMYGTNKRIPKHMKDYGDKA